MDLHWNAHGNIYRNNRLYSGKKIAQEKIFDSYLWILDYIFESKGMIHTRWVIKKLFVSFSNDYIGLTYGFLNMIPPGVALFTTGAHCYVYYHLFQLRATKNIDRTLEYTMGKLSTYVVTLLHLLRII